MINNAAKIIIFVKTNVFPWIRLNRVVRDIPTQNIIGGNKITNLRQIILQKENKERLSMKSLERAKIYDWSVIVDKYINLYYQLIKKRTSRL